ncbi:redox-sensitive transcriptional activator SoxR [Dactylosporangium sp. NPDC051541]|uniref:redox-sensitive transcriptional activator SoxR n=1 Tax=Dactylosporangium sp. NPDC051541 TaxID=3363977 RepID=UPI0037AA7CA6
MTGATNMTIGELASRSGVPASALRFYERQGLISSDRNATNQRRYDDAAAKRVAFIRASQRVGIPLAQIAEVLAFLPAGHPPTAAFWRRASQCWGQAVDERIARLERDREQFTACAGCGCLTFGECRLVTPA